MHSKSSAEIGTVATAWLQPDHRPRALSKLYPLSRAVRGVTWWQSRHLNRVAMLVEPNSVHIMLLLVLSSPQHLSPELTGSCCSPPPSSMAEACCTLQDTRENTGDCDSPRSGIHGHGHGHRALLKRKLSDGDISSHGGYRRSPLGARLSNAKKHLILQTTLMHCQAG